MKKILCPVDFSVASKNGLEYAGNLAASMMAHLTLHYVSPSIWPEAIQLEGEAVAGMEVIASTLQVLSEQVEKEFGITCGLHITQTTDVVEKVIAEQAANYDLIAMGTNGADDFYQLAFGSRSFHVIQQAMCPVLVIPERCSYQPIRLIVYAFDPDTNPMFLVDQLKELAVSINAAIKVLHVMEDEPSKENDEKLKTMEQAVMARASKFTLWSFDGRYGNDVAWTLEHYANSNSVDMLALSFHHRSLIDKLFRQNVIKRISMTADFPVFTFWR